MGVDAARKRAGAAWWEQAERLRRRCSEERAGAVRFGQKQQILKFFFFSKTPFGAGAARFAVGAGAARFRSRCSILSVEQGAARLEQVQ